MSTDVSSRGGQPLALRRGSLLLDLLLLYILKPQGDPAGELDELLGANVDALGLPIVKLFALEVLREVHQARNESHQS